MSATQTAILCKKCKEVLTNEDDIFGTSCGHLYHFLCLRECHGRSSHCTDCDAYKPSMFKMFLDFGNAPMSFDDQMKMIELHKITEESQSTIKCLEEKQKYSQNNVQQLEGKLKKLNDAVKTKDNTITDLEDRIATLEELNTYLTNENAQKNKTSNSYNNCESIVNILKDQLKEETRKNAQLSLENMKIKALFHAINKEEYLTNIAQETDATSDGEETLNIELSNHDTTDNCKIAIHNYTSKTLKQPLKDNIKELASQMKLKLSNKDIKRVKKIKTNGENIKLIVEFANEELKKNFLDKQYLLKSVSKKLEIVEVEIDEDET